jgi:hypothetical protein
MKSSTHPVRLPAHLTVVFTLARLLQRLDLSVSSVDALQYQGVARRLAEELDRVSTDESLSAILRAHPSAAEVYENLHYAHAGLCRAPLELAVDAESETRALLARVTRRDEAGRMA